MMRVWRLSVSRLSVAYLGPTERPRKTKIGTEVGNVTRDSDTSFKVKDQIGGVGAYCGGLPHSLLYQLSCSAARTGITVGSVCTGYDFPRENLGLPNDNDMMALRHPGVVEFSAMGSEVKVADLECVRGRRLRCLVSFFWLRVVHYSMSFPRMVHETVKLPLPCTYAYGPRFSAANMHIHLRNLPHVGYQTCDRRVWNSKTSCET